MDPVSATPTGGASSPSSRDDVQSLVHLGSVDEVIAAAKAHPDEAQRLYDGLVAANRYSDARSLADAAPGADGGRSFLQRSWDEVQAAGQHPDQAVIGAGKGIVNTLSGLGTLFAQGSAYQAAGEADQAAAIQSLFGQADAAKRSAASAEALREAAPQMRLPTLPFNTPAEAGGDKIATVAMTVADGVGLAKGLASAGGRIAARTTARAATDAAREALPVLKVSKSATPEIAQNIQTAIAEGKPSVLTRLEGKDAIRANRSAALKGEPKPPTTHSLDEYPFASSKEGGAGSRVAAVPRTEQNVQGGQLSSFYQAHKINDGDQFRVQVAP